MCPRALWCVLIGSGYLHALNLVSLVRALLVRAGWKWLPAYLEPRVLVRALLVRVLVGSGYLHALNLVSLVGVSLVRVLVRVSLVRVLVGVVTCMP